MRLEIFQVDAFATRCFEGNPAAICPLEHWLPDALMQNIAQENNLAETAFFVPEGEGFRLRWFTPTVEVDLCGHATLAAAHVLFAHLGCEARQITFESRSGPLHVERRSDVLTLDFPSDRIAASECDGVQDALGIAVAECYRGRDDLLAVVENEAALTECAPDMGKIAQLDCRGVIVSTEGETADFVSRFFAPQSGIPEDAVTGSAHTTLTPFWSGRLGRKKLVARQLSARGGTVYCEALGERVRIGGHAATYMHGEIFLD